MTELEAYALIERYLSGEMPAAEAEDFEAQLRQNPDLARYSREFDDLTGKLQALGRRRSLKARMNNLHSQYFPEAITQEPATFREQRDMVTQSQFQAKWRSFYKANRTTMAVAASVAILTVFSTLLSIELWNSMGKEQNIRYTELRRDMDRIKKSQRAIIKGFNQKVAPKTEINPGTFSGTGFALTSDGYIATSFHVINDADSVFIENTALGRFKATTVFKDAAHDLAILKISDPNFTSFDALPYTVAQTDADLGEKVYTLGFPREDMVFGEGSLSSQSGFDGDTAAYQISVPLNPGNSGGPLFDEKGNLIGVIKGKQLDQQGAAFATKSSYLLNMTKQVSPDSAKDINLGKQNNLAGRPRKQQLKKIKDYIFMVKVYN
jgi:serine protease Do